MDQFFVPSQLSQSSNIALSTNTEYQNTNNLRPLGFELNCKKRIAYMDLLRDKMLLSWL